MKKSIITLALVMAAGLAMISTDAMAWGYGNCGARSGYGAGTQSSGTTSKAYQDFLNSTSDLRAEIGADRAELAAVMASPEPDPKKVRSLTERINENIATLNEKAAAQNIPAYGMMGRGMGRGMGPGMMGRGMGHGMGPGMMGSNGYNSGNGYNCPRY